MEIITGQCELSDYELCWNGSLQKLKLIT